MKKYRIVRKNSLYFLQHKGWIFWHSYGKVRGTRELTRIYPTYYDSLEKAMEKLDEIITTDIKILRDKFPKTVVKTICIDKHGNEVVPR